MSVINDPEIDIIVELIGGTTVAKKIIFEGLKKGKTVVTANKALISEYSKELFELARKNKAHLFYEAANWRWYSHY